MRYECGRANEISRGSTRLIVIWYQARGLNTGANKVVMTRRQPLTQLP